MSRSGLDFLSALLRRDWLWAALSSQVLPSHAAPPTEVTGEDSSKKLGNYLGFLYCFALLGWSG